MFLIWIVVFPLFKESLQNLLKAFFCGFDVVKFYVAVDAVTSKTCLLALISFFDLPPLRHIDLDESLHEDLSGTWLSFQYEYLIIFDLLFNKKKHSPLHAIVIAKSMIIDRRVLPEIWMKTIGDLGAGYDGIACVTMPAMAS